MSKHNQYYSDWEETPDDDYYRDQTTRETDADYRYDDRRHHDYQQQNESYQNADQRSVRATTDDPYYDSGFDGRQGEHYPTPYSEEYYDRESDRGFNLVNIADFRDRDFHDVHPEEIDYYDTPQHRLPHDQQDLISDITNHGKSIGIQVVADDFIDTPKSNGGFRVPKAVTAIGALLFMLALVFGILHSSRPELSAYDIVQMDSYDGQQPTPSIFNLTDLNDCISLKDCIKETISASRADIAQSTRDTFALREIPAVNTVPNNPNTTTSTSLPAVEQTVLVNTQAADQMEVIIQWSIIRTAPSSTGEIITSLAKGINVRLISTVGSWYEIVALDSKGTRGYMHQSTIGSL